MPVGDRRWAVVDEQGAKLTARTVPAMLRVRAEPAPGGGVRLTAPSGQSLDVPRPVHGLRVPVSLRGVPQAADAGDEAGRDASLSMLRLRPNVVGDGAAPFAEEAWPSVRSGLSCSAGSRRATAA